MHAVFHPLFYPTETVLALLTDTALKSVLVLGAALLAGRAMRSSYAAARHLVLSTAMLGLLILPLVSFLLPMRTVWPSLNRIVAPARTVSLAPVPLTWAGGQGDGIVPAKAGIAGPRSPWNQSIAGSSGSTSAGAAVRPWVAAFARRWVAAIWLGGALLAALPTVLGWGSLWRLGRRSQRVASGRGAKLLGEWMASPQGRRGVTLWQTAERRIPMTWGVWQPRVLLPEDAARWPEERLRVALQHELAHVQLRDALSNLLAQIVCALYWFNPLAWWAARQLRTEREAACDDVVLASGTRPSRYAEEVLHVAASLATGGGAPRGAVAMAHCSNLESRLRAILDGQRRRGQLTRRAVLAAAAILAGMAVPWVVLRAAPAPAAAGSEPGATREPAASPPAKANGLVAWWHGDGDGKDGAGGHDGEFPFGVRYAPGIHGQAFDFTRSYAIGDLLQRVSIPDAPDFESEDVTLEAWVKPASYGGIILMRGDDRPGLDSWFLMSQDNGKLAYGFNSVEKKQVTVITGTPLKLNEWQHIAATFTRGELKLYVDGALKEQAKTELHPIRVLDPEISPAIGIGNTGGKYYNLPFNGLIDEVRVYNRALAAEEITADARLDKPAVAGGGTAPEAKSTDDSWFRMDWKADYTYDKQHIISRKVAGVKRRIESATPIEIKDGHVTKFADGAIFKLEQTGGAHPRQGELRAKDGRLELWIKDDQDFHRGGPADETWLREFLTEIAKE